MNSNLSLNMRLCFVFGILVTEEIVTQCFGGRQSLLWINH